ncbi:MAG: guanylate kinase [Lachnospiraceae bacterium]|jgi:guanylate kinase|nr:guanylate kinase [Lachnospiraceae bacterium]
MQTRGILTVISGFAGTGKGTVVKGIMEKYEDYALSVSMTTRSPRPGETDGESYFFVSREEFEKNIAENGFIEYAEYVGNYYGTPKAYVEKKLDEGKNVILEIEIQGAMNVKKLFPDAVLIFIMPPGADELERRLSGRGTETAEVIKKRMDRAALESEGIEDYDYIAVNDNVDDCVEAVNGIIRASRLKPAFNTSFIEKVRNDLKEKARRN